MKNKRCKVLASAAVVTLVTAGSFTTNVQATSLKRIGEGNRYTTAQKVAKEIFYRADNVVLVNGKGYADAVSATPLAKQLNAPILLTEGKNLENGLAKTISDLKAKNIYIVGGKGVVSSNVYNALKNKGLKVTRFATSRGGRFHTNAIVAKEVLRRSGKKSAVLVNGSGGYADALSVASVAAKLGYPVLITDSQNVHSEIKRVINSYKLGVLVVGGKGVVSDNIVKELNGKRIAEGADRFETNLKVLEYFKGDLDFTNMYVASGGNDNSRNFADALVASAAAAKSGAPVVLTGLGARDRNIKGANDFVKYNINKNTKVSLIGGTSVLKSSIENDLRRIVDSREKADMSNSLPYDRKFVVIGDRAYSMNYFRRHSKKINSDLNKGNGLIFYCYESGNNNRILNVVTKKFLSEKQLMEECGKNLTFYDTYDEKNFIFNDVMFKESNITANKYNAVIKNARVGNRRLVNVSIDSRITRDIVGAKYFQIKGSPLVKSINSNNEIQAMLSKDDSHKTNVEVYILDSNKNIIAKGDIDITDLYSDKEEVKIDFDLTDSETKNAVGNITNGGMVVQRGNYIYYNNTADKNKLYKRSLNGIFNEEICRDNARYMNLFDDCIIYSNSSDQSKIYKVNTDGTHKEKISDDMASYINVVGEYIYYSNHSDSGKLYKIKINRTESGLTFGTPEKICDDQGVYLNVVGNTIYYSNYLDKNKLYAINTDGTGRAKLSNDFAKYTNVSDDYVYYCTDDGKLKRVSVDKSEVSDLFLPEGVSSLNVMGDYIYYTNILDDNKIYRVNKNHESPKFEKVCDDEADNINIVGSFVDVVEDKIRVTGDTLYYTNKNKLYEFNLKDSGDNEKSGEQVKKPKNDTKISKVYNLDLNVSGEDKGKSIKYIQENYLPERVTALMDDDSVKELLVDWDINKVKETDGSLKYSGYIVGYDTTVTLTIHRTAANVDRSNVTIENRTEYSDKVIVRDLADEVTVRVYKDEDMEHCLGSASANSDGEAEVSVHLEKEGGKVWITVQSDSEEESDPTSVYYGAEGPGTPNDFDIEDEDDTYEGIDGRDFKAKWSPLPENVIKQYIYILRDDEDLDMKKHKPIVTIYDRKTRYWTGTSDLKQDSNKEDFKEGYYHAYLVLENKYGSKSIKESDGFEVEKEKGKHKDELKVPTNFTMEDKDDRYSEIDGRDFTGNWTSLDKEIVKQYIYILREDEYFDINNEDLNPVETIDDGTTTHWTGGSYLDQDSMDEDFEEGYYYAYLVVEDEDGRKAYVKSNLFKVHED